jgi:hypothetical protein
MEKNIKDGLFMKRRSLHNFLYTLYLDCIYYKTNLEDFSLYVIDFSRLLCLENHSMDSSFHGLKHVHALSDGKGQVTHRTNASNMCVITSFGCVDFLF